MAKGVVLFGLVAFLAPPYLYPQSTYMVPIVSASLPLAGVETGSPDDWQTYRNGDYSFTFRYPKSNGWKIQGQPYSRAAGDSGLNVSLSLMNSTANSGLQVGIGLSVSEIKSWYQGEIKNNACSGELGGYTYDPAVERFYFHCATQRTDLEGIGKSLTSVMGENKMPTLKTRDGLPVLKFAYDFPSFARSCLVRQYIILEFPRGKRIDAERPHLFSQFSLSVCFTRENPNHAGQEEEESRKLLEEQETVLEQVIQTLSMAPGQAVSPRAIRQGNIPK